MPVIKWIYNIVLFVRRKNADVHSSSLLIDVYALLTLAPDGRLPMTQAEKFPDPFCSRAMLICSIIWLGKRMLRVVVLRVLFFVDMRLPRIQCRWFVLFSCFYVVDADQLPRYLRLCTDYLIGLMASTHVVIWMIIIITLRVLSGEKGTKNIVVSSEP